jgi:hypothetical protein
LDWSAYRQARRRSRQAWVLLAATTAGTLGGLFWFFTAGQFALAEPTPTGPVEAPVFDPSWMKPVDPPHRIPQGRALDALERLAVKGRSAGSDYSRELFGQAWLDVDRNGCDTRNDILRRDLTDVTFTQGSSCRVAAGRFQEPYTSEIIEFRRGSESSRAVQIDHVVALADAWEKGARNLSPAERHSLANDPVNLIAADGAANQLKGAGDAATWLPANKSIRCHYVARQVSVKAAYGLWVTAAEKDAMRRVLAPCPAQQTVRAG